MLQKADRYTSYRLEDMLALQNLLWARNAKWLDDRELLLYIERIEAASSLKNLALYMANSKIAAI